MPFTPFHMGPGLLIKAILQGGFSLMVFGWAQILMDLQPLFVLISGEGHLHGFSHTLMGASVIGIASALTGKYLGELGLRILRISDNPISISWFVASLSALIGSFSHVFIDSIMHADLHPYAPFTNANPLLGFISVDLLHKLCLYSSLLGAGLYFLIHLLIDKKLIDKKSQAK